MESREHAAEVARIADRVREFAGTDRQPRVVQDSSHSVGSADDVIDISALDSVLHIDEDARQAVVEPNVPMDRLVDATLEHGFIPPVVMEFPGITVGGGIQGGAGESSSFRYGCFHKCFDRYELVLGNGEVVTASEDERQDLFHGSACSYGSLGVLTRARMDLLPAHTHVDLTYRRVESAEEAVAVMMDAVERDDVDFVDGLLFGPDRGVVMTGRRTSDPQGPVNRVWRARDDWFYLHAEKAMERAEVYRESMPVRDYLFRYDRGAFWMGERGFPGFLPFNREARTVLDPLFRTRDMFRMSTAGNLLSRNIVQDPCLPQDEVVPFVDWVDEHFGIYPLWLLPLAPDSETFLSPTCIGTDDLVIDVGVYGRPDRSDAWTATRAFEERVAEAGGRQTLYAHQYWPEDGFWEIYDRDRHEQLREAYGAVGTFPDVYTATHVADPEPPSMEQFTKEMLRPGGWF